MTPEDFYRYVDPVSGVSIVDEAELAWINDPVILRMFGVGHLGLSREAPTYNPRSRGDHSASTGVCSAVVAGRNRFSKDDIRRAMVYGGYHDPHPAGGDGLKLALTINEESVAEEYFFRGRNLDRFNDRCQKWGWGGSEIQREVMALIERKLGTPMGELVHGSSKLRADVDFLNYTYGDLGINTCFSRISNYCGVDCGERREAHGCPVIMDLINVGIKHGMIFSGGEFAQSNRVITQVFNHNAFDFLSQMKWDKDQGWFMDSSEVYAHFVIASAMLHKTLYFHPGMQGPEMMLAKGINSMGIGELIKQVAMDYDDEALVKQLGEYGLDYWVTPRAHDGWRYSDVGSRVGLGRGEYKFKLPPFNLRLETLVHDEYSGEVIPFNKARPDVLGFVNQMFGFGNLEVILVDDLWRERPNLN